MRRAAGFILAAAIAALAGASPLRAEARDNSAGHSPLHAKHGEGPIEQDVARAFAAAKAQGALVLVDVWAPW